MRRFLAGVITGGVLGFLVLGPTPSVRAGVGSFFISVSEIYAENSSFQRGYIAGVYDSVQVLAPIAGQGSALYRVANCLDRQGDTIGQFEIYAGGALRRAPSPRIAAADPIMAACVRQ
jgi:hypothetical protein